MWTWCYRQPAGDAPGYVDAVKTPLDADGTQWYARVPYPSAEMPGLTLREVVQEMTRRIKAWQP